MSQGWSLSPLLFILCVEVSNTGTKEVYKLRAFVNYLLLILENSGRNRFINGKAKENLVHCLELKLIRKNKDDYESLSLIDGAEV